MSCARWNRPMQLLPASVERRQALRSRDYRAIRPGNGLARGRPGLPGSGQLDRAPAATGRRRYARRVEVRSLGYRTDLMIRVLEGSQVEDHGDYLVIRSPRNPTYWWGNFLLLAAPKPGQARRWLAAFRSEFPAA